MFLIDDLLLRSTGVSLKPFDMLWIMEMIRDLALKEKYDTGRISSQIKENRLLFELGEMSEKEYREKQEQLLEELDKAKEIMESLPNDMRIQEEI